MSNIGEIAYYKDPSIARSPINYFNSENIIHHPFRKRKNFSKDQEVRMTFPYSLDKIENSSLKVKYFLRIPFPPECVKKHNLFNDKFPNKHFLNDDYLQRYINVTNNENILELDNLTDYRKSIEYNDPQ